MLYGEYNKKSKNKKVKFISFIYAHGQLDNLLRHDLIYSDNDAVFDTISNLPVGERVKIETLIEDNNNISHNAIMLIWNPVGFKIAKGLVVLEGDTEAYKYASKMYEEMPMAI